MAWTPPVGVTPIDRKPPSSPTYADIPAVLDWLRLSYSGHTVIGLLITARATGTTYRIDAEPPYGTPGTLDNYLLTPFGDSSAGQVAREAQADARQAQAGVQQVAAGVDALRAEGRLPDNDLIVGGTTDQLGSVVQGITPHGSVLHGWADDLPADLTGGPYVAGWADSAGQVAAGLDDHGHWHEGDSYTMPAPEGLSGGMADRDGYVREACDALGRPVPTGEPVPVVWQAGDQIYSMVDGTVRQLTQGVGNSGPTLSPDGRYVTYTSTRSGPAQGAQLVPMRADVRGLGEARVTDWGDESRLNHLYITGQSLSLGVRSVPPLSSVQPYGHAKFSDGTRSRGGNAVTLVPLVEDQVQDNFFDGSPIGETALSAVANSVSRELERRGDRVQRHRILGSASGRGGTAINGIRQGTDIYNNGLAQFDAGRRIAGAAWRLSAILMIHGENDDSGNNTDYHIGLREFLKDYQYDVNQRIASHPVIPMFVWQISCWGIYSNRATPVTPPLVLRASEDNADRIYLVGPSYWIPAAEWDPDRIHMRSAGTYHASEKFAQAYRQVVLEGRPWLPLKPISTRITGRTILVRYHVPAPPLALDTSLVSDPGNYGIEVEGPDGGLLALARVAVSGPDTVTITLAADPPAGALWVRHAWTAVPGQGAGPDIGPRCCLRDSDPLVSVLDGKKLYNWAVVSRRPVPYGG